MMEDYVKGELHDMNQNDLNKNKIRHRLIIRGKNNYTVNEDVMHISMNENKTENNWDTLEEVIYECPYDTSSVVMEDYVNEELDNSNHNYLME